jgi:hypothetical protein
MASDKLSDDVQANTAQFTTERLRDLILDHVLDNTNVFLQDGPGAAEKLTTLLDSLEKMGQKIAAEAITNRHNLSPLPTFKSSISANPEQDVNDSTRYEMRYRMIEQINDEPPFKDEVMTQAEVEEEYGAEFMQAYWGQLGEKCPNTVKTGDRTIWFSVVRYPVTDQSATQQANANETPRYRAPSQR